MSKVNDYYNKCATCENYALGSKSSMKAGVGFRCSKYGKAMPMDDHCASHMFMSGYSWNRRVTDQDITSAEKMLRSPNSFCFITTAIVEILQDDYGYVVLDKLKHFRNDVLQANPVWHAILRNYDVVGPKIADALRNDPDRLEVCKTLFRKYLNKCAMLVDSGDDVKDNTLIDDVYNPYYQRFVQEYVAMTNWLANKYGIENTFEDVVFSEDEVSYMGHGNPEEEKIQKGFGHKLIK
jgi:translation initiation factor 2 beta subunit (eIF-2beta)/eIF-5